MNEHVQFVMEKKLERTKAALEKNNMETFIADSAADVVSLAKEMVPEGALVANGGSATLVECGLYAMFKEGNYRFVDRDGAPEAEKPTLARESLSVEYYFASANAITEDGCLYEMDGRGNRVAALSFGPKTVVIVAGHNKIVPDLEAARQRNRHIAAPANVHRLHRATPCGTTGTCMDCASPERICNIEVVIRRCLDKDRIKVILVKEELGF